MAQPKFLANVKPAEEAPFDEQERNPSAWEITSPEEGRIEALNGLTKRKFAGTFERFNKLLRGE